MDSDPELVYDNETGEVRWVADDTSVRFHSDVDPADFELVEEIHELAEDSALLVEWATRPERAFALFLGDGKSLEFLHTTQQTAVENYERCLHLQDVLSEGSYPTALEYEGLLFKTNKLLKHYFRTLSVAQGIAYSNRLLANYGSSQNHMYQYGFIRNVCSTVEHLGKYVEARDDEGGTIDLDGNEWYCVNVYRELRQLDSGEPKNADLEVTLEPYGQTECLGDIIPSVSSVQCLWDLRCEIAHGCPLVIPDMNTSDIPDDLLSNTVISWEELGEAVYLAHCLHYYTVCLFVQYASSYVVDMVEPLVDGVYAEQNEEG